MTTSDPRICTLYRLLYVINLEVLFYFPNFGNFGEVSGNVTGRTGVPPQSLAHAMSVERDLAVVAVSEPTR